MYKDCDNHYYQNRDTPLYIPDCVPYRCMFYSKMFYHRMHIPSCLASQMPLDLEQNCNKITPTWHFLIVHSCCSGEPICVFVMRIDMDIFVHNMALLHFSATLASHRGSLSILVSCISNVGYR